MWANSGVDHSFLSHQMRENLSNVHFRGGNLVFADGHAEYRKYKDLRSGHFGLTPDEPYEPTRDQSGRDYDAAF
jgi:prepilin-type processing-associated H-X9-DG protein